MRSRHIAILLVVAGLGLVPASASAQTADAPAVKRGTTPKRAQAKRLAKPAAQAAAAVPAGRSPLLDPEGRGTGGDRASSLERRRKAFFAPKPDEGGVPADASSAPAGVTLGGSGGLTPGMGFKF